jgi:hypothetical protein
MYSYQDPWDAEQWADEEAQLRADLAVEQARATRAQAELQSLKSQDPDALVAKLAKERGESVEQTQAQLDAIRAAAKQPAQKPAGDPNKLSELLDNIPDGDFEAAAKAIEAAGYQRLDALGQTWAGGRLQRTGDPKGSTAEIYAFLDQATSFDDYQARLAQVGLLEGGAS